MGVDMKVKIINADNVWELEDKVNRFLKDINDSQIVDIKYQGIGNHGLHSIDRPSVMVITRT